MKSIIVAGGFGTRLLPATKNIPKEIFPILNFPVIDFICEEIISSNLNNDIILLSGRNKHALEDYFDKNYELEDVLRKKGKEDLIKHKNINISYIRQLEPLGTGHAIAKCEHLINSAFYVTFPDMIIDNSAYYVNKMLDYHNQTQKTVIALMEIPKDKISQYGVVIGNIFEDDLILIEDMIEKPSQSDIEKNDKITNFAIVGKYIFPNKIFDNIKNVQLTNGEYYITDAIQELAKHEEVYGIIIRDEIHDIGNPLGYLKASLYYGMKEYKEEIIQYMDYLKEF